MLLLLFVRAATALVRSTTHSVPMLLNLAIVEPPQITALDEDCLALAVDPSEHHTMCDKKVSIKIPHMM